MICVAAVQSYAPLVVLGAMVTRMGAPVMLIAPAKLLMDDDACEAIVVGPPVSESEPELSEATVQSYVAE